MRKMKASSFIDKNILFGVVVAEEYLAACFGAGRIREFFLSGNSEI